MKYILSILLFINSFFSFSQRELQGIGEWEFHVPHGSGIAIANTNDLIYSASKLGMFSYDKTTGEITIFSKSKGLSDVNIADIQYNTDLELLIIAYKNGNIDILKDNVITNFNAILRKQIVGIKNVFAIELYDKYALISTSFGVVVFDLIKLEVKETYSSLSESGEPLSVTESVVLNDTLFLATEAGILKGDFSGNSNLLDYNNWENIYPNNSIKNLSYSNDELYALLSDTALVIKKNKHNWDTITELKNTEKFNKSNDNLYFIDKNQNVKELSNNTLKNLDFINGNISQIINEGDIYWVCNGNFGLFKITESTKESLTPNTLINDEIFNITYSNGVNYITPGGHSKTSIKLFRPLVIDQLSYSQWSTTGYWTDPLLDSVSDINMCISKADESVYFASHTKGLIEKKDNIYNVYNESNSPIKGVDNTGKNIRVTSLAIDDDENLWLTNHGLSYGLESIHKIDNDGNWESFKFTEIQSYIYPLKIFIDQNNVKWVTLGSTVGGNGVLVFDNQNETSRLLTTGFSKGDLQENKINDISFSSDGSIWMVGRAGVSVFQNPESIFDGGEENDATKPIFEGRPLMENEYCTAIEIDGGDRKWIGTENGLFLFNSTGTELIENFNEENSPLPTNKINDLELNPETGELFIGTDFGLITYRTNSSKGKASCKGQIKVFPNPVKSDFDGEIGISVLTEDAEIKITDAWGNLAYETKANGGTASWDLNDYTGNKAQNGVYTILVNGVGRKSSCTENLAIIK